jgi:deoxyadenosine/deoxycytidine kinase
MAQIISIEGNIGSGKSTLLAHLKSHFCNNSQIIFLREPVEEWESIKDLNGTTMLEKFYKDQNKYSFSFQMLAYISRLALLKETTQTNPNCIIITERSLYTDKYVFAKMLYDMGNIEDVNYQIYTKWFETFAEDYPISKGIYVNADPEICHERIIKRSRTGEDNIPLNYLENCHIYNEDMISLLQKNNEKYKQLVLNGNTDIYMEPNELEKWVQQISEFIYK